MQCDTILLILEYTALLQRLVLDLTYSSDEQQQSKPANRLGGGKGFCLFKEDFEQRVIKMDYQRDRL